MRMRRKPWARPELDASEIYIKNPHDYFGHWEGAYMLEQPLHLELGCGKGGFISKKAVKNPNINYLAIDIKSEVLATAKRNIEKEYLEENIFTDNIRITAFDIGRLSLIISEEDRFERIYINFCNPWPKDRHKKRRLTHTRQLENYKLFLADNAQIHFKTDDDMLFIESCEYFKEAGYEIIFKTEDLHASPWEDNIVTEHEDMFTKEGIKIKALIAVYKK